MPSILTLRQCLCECFFLVEKIFLSWKNLWYLLLRWTFSFGVFVCFLWISKSPYKQMFATCELVDLFVFSQCFSPKVFGKQPHFLFKKTIYSRFCPSWCFLNKSFDWTFDVVQCFVSILWINLWATLKEKRPKLHPQPALNGLKWCVPSTFSRVKILKSTWTNHLLMVFSGFRKVFFWGGGRSDLLLFHTTSWFHARGDISPFPSNRPKLKVNGITLVLGRGTTPSCKP